MNLKNIDIVLPLRAGDDNEELRYTLRSIEENVPHRYLWLLDHKPIWVSDEAKFIPVKQESEIPSHKASYSVKQATRDPRISDNFIVWHDDIFAMKPRTTIELFNRGTLKEYKDLVKSKNPEWSEHWTRLADNTEQLIRRLGATQRELFSFELHHPCFFNKAKLKYMFELIYDFERPNLNDLYNQTFLNTLYFNLYPEPSVKGKDPKIVGLDVDPQQARPDSEYLSTIDESFKYGKVGEYIRSQFTEKSKYER